MTDIARRPARRYRLPAGQPVAIYLDQRPYEFIMTDFQVDKPTITKIKRGLIYRSETADVRAAGEAFMALRGAWDAVHDEGRRLFVSWLLQRHAGRFGLPRVGRFRRRADVASR